jgi:hypothetical protein
MSASGCKADIPRHGVREASLRGGPERQIAVVRRCADSGNRSIDAVFRAVVAAHR